MQLMSTIFARNRMLAGLSEGLWRKSHKSLKTTAILKIPTIHQVRLARPNFGRGTGRPPSVCWLKSEQRSFVRDGPLEKWMGRGGGGGEFSACTNFFFRSLLVREFFFRWTPLYEDAHWHYKEWWDTFCTSLKCPSGVCAHPSTVGLNGVKKGVGRQHTTFTSCQNAACSNIFVLFLWRVDYALEENVLTDQMWLLPLISDWEVVTRILIFCGHCFWPGTSGRHDLPSDARAFCLWPLLKCKVLHCG